MQVRSPVAGFDGGVAESDDGGEGSDDDGEGSDDDAEGSDDGAEVSDDDVAVMHYDVVVGNVDYYIFVTSLERNAKREEADMGQSCIQRGGSGGSGRAEVCRGTLALALNIHESMTCASCIL